MRRRSRRGFLAGLAAAGSLSGCLSVVRSGGGGGSTPAGLTLDTYDVGGSPGKTVPVQPAGEVALLDFFATWCAPCKPQMEELRAIRSQFPGVHMLSITWESDADLVRSFWREYEGTWAVASDPKVRTGQEFGVERIPTLLVFDAEGTEQWRHVGLASAESIAEQLQAAGASANG